MKTCKNDNNKILAKGLCRKCYDAQPERIAIRTGKVKAKHIYSYYNNTGVKRASNAEYMRAWRANQRKTYKDTAEFKEYVEKYKETDAYRAYIKASNRKRSMNSRAKKRGGVYDSKTRTWRKPDTYDSQISQRVTRHSTGSQRQTVSPQA